MRVEVLTIEGCPNGAAAARHLEAALTAEGRAASVELRLVCTAAEAATSAFGGSPTITIDGVDLFPEGGSVDGLACRVYATPAGLAGTPSVDQIRAAIRVLDD
ncbi:hypothetical protein GCM10009846_22610 [Agrococcus versicolor]|uniref:Thioredoxin family protein n=1 Tax=Agrococcus versicolor TaxID=501482 RepID=A0ABN3AUG9_9MICO